MSNSSDHRYDEIRKHWKTSAESAVDADGLKATARDPFLQEVVEVAMEKWIEKDTDLLDVGCGDGASTRRFAAIARKVVGADYIDRYVERAREESAGISNAVFAQGDILDLSGIVREFGQFGAVTTIRCLINLPDWAAQRKALEQIAEALRSGGLYLVSEGWQEGMDGLNLRRKKAGLVPIKVAEYNTMMTRTDFEAEINRHFDIVAYENCGFYMFMSRVVQPLFLAPDPPIHDHPLNRIGAELTVSGVASDEFVDCDYAGVYVLRRR